MKTYPMTAETMLVPMSVADFVAALKAEILDALSTKQEKDLQEKLLSPAETCKLFQPAITKPTLAKWTKEGRLQEYRMNGRVFYKYSEVLQSLTTLKKYKRG
jgi:hypothetical protein